MRKLISVVVLSGLCATLFSLPANAVDTRNCAQGGPCAVGDVGPGGGVVFYSRTAGTFSDSYSFTFSMMGMPRTNVVSISLGSTEVSGLLFDYLEAAPASGIVSVPQSSVDGGTAAAATLGSGQVGTLTFLADFPSDNSSNNASWYADGYVVNGKADWFLPSVDELALLVNRHLRNELGLADPIVGANLNFWTSSNQVTLMKSGSGYYKQFGDNSHRSHSVIPIRAFSSTPAPSATPTPDTAATPVVSESKITTNSKIKFDRSSSALTKAGKAKLRKLAAGAPAGSSVVAVVSVGRLDGVADTHLRRLAKQRSAAISRYLNRFAALKNSFTVKIVKSGIKPVTKVTVN